MEHRTYSFLGGIYFWWHSQIHGIVKSSIRGLLSLFVVSISLLPVMSWAAIPTSERNALIALYNASNGDSWTENTGWLGTAGTECSWYGITCVGDHVTNIFLPANNMVGTIPTELANLPNLVELVIQVNQLSGTIPSELGMLINLQDLALTQNQLTGTIPAELGNLTNLRMLGLNSNQLTGTIPVELFNLSNLEFFIVSSNQLSGPVPVELGNLIKLRYLSLTNNQFSGSIPSQLGNLTNLVQLGIHGNELSGEIPIELGNLANLETLILGRNQLTGSIPPELGNLVNLTFLRLDDNQLSGEIPPELGKLNSISALQLNGNQLSGVIPNELGDLVNIQYLYLNNNQLIGAIPEELGNLTNLQQLHLYNNMLSNIPVEFGNLINLQELRLSSNQLVGEIPSSLINLVNLTYNDMSFNGLYSNDTSLLSHLNQTHPLNDLMLTQTLDANGLIVTDIGNNSVELAWDAVTFMSPGGYRVYLFHDSSLGFQQVAEVSDKTVVTTRLTGLDACTNYSVQVKSYSAPHAGNAHEVESDGQTGNVERFTTMGCPSIEPQPSSSGGGCSLRPSGQFDPLLPLMVLLLLVYLINGNGFKWRE